MNVIEMLRDRAAERPTTVAIVSGSGSRERAVTLRELDRMSARTAHQLRVAGIGEGDRVLVMQPMGIPLYAILLGLFRIGAVAVLVDASASIRNMARACRRGNLKLAVGPRFAKFLKWLLPALRPVRWLSSVETGGGRGGKLDVDTTQPRDAEIVRVRADAPALITFTSGSTGEPKAAVRSHGFLRAQHAVVEDSLGVAEGDVELTSLPVFVVANIASGITSILPDARIQTPARIDPGPVVRQVMRWEPNRALGSPAFFRSLVRGFSSRRGESPIKRIFTGGGPVFPAMIREIQHSLSNAEVIVVYGSTEAEPISHVSASEITPEQWQAMGRGRGLLVGKPIPQIAVRVIASVPGVSLRNMREKHFQQLICATDEAGEIVVSGDHVLSGYLEGIGDETTKFRVDGRVWHRTGDAGCIDKEGAIWLLGRCEAVVKDKHGVMYPFAVECCALQHDWVKVAACVAWEGERTLLVVPKRESTEDERRALCEGLEWVRLMHVMEVTHIPLDRRHNAKVEYPRLKELLRCYRYVKSAKVVGCAIPA